MAPSADDMSLEEQIGQWRGFLRRRTTVNGADADELEGHLRDQVAALRGRGLAADEAFLVAVKRMGNLDTIAREFAREHSERLWKQLVLSPAADVGAEERLSREPLVAVCLAVAAAIAVKIPALFGLELGEDVFYARNASLFVLPLLAWYFGWKRGASARLAIALAGAFVAAAVAANIYPFEATSDTLTLSALHLPIALWLAVGIAYTAGRWFEGDCRMNFVRFSGELLIYYALIALGGGVFMALMAMLVESIGIDAEPLAEWVVPCGAAGAVLIASWLVEAKQSVVENMAPVLTRIFTPLFAALLLAFLGTLLWTGRGIDVQREVLIGFDLLLAVVVGLVVYAISARDPVSPPGAFDRLQLVLVLSALVVDAVALAAIASRISEFGFTPNRVAALGENVILLVNLGWSAWLYFRFITQRGGFGALERWQMAYLPVYAVWAAVVVLLFPPLFGYR